MAFDTFAEAMAHLVATPGARSDDKIFMSGRRAGKSFAMNVLKGRDQIQGTSVDAIWIDEIGEIMATNAAPMSQEVTDRLNDLAVRMTEYFQANKEQVTLLSPGSLTVTIPGKGYSKANHIGGEQFTIDRVRVGSAKAGSRLIFVFKPTAASSYSDMEMTENEAQTQLDGFRSAANFAAGGDFLGELKAIRRIDSIAREHEAAKEKVNDYPEFGAW